MTATEGDAEDNKVFVAVRVRPLNASERNASASAWNVVSTNAIAPQVRRKKRNESNVVNRCFRRRCANDARALV
jgi:hypothetical protein